MGWLDWCSCWRAKRPQEDESQICQTTSSQLSSASSSVSEDPEMGQTVSRIKEFFCPEKPPVAHTSDVETPEVGNSPREPLIDQSWEPLATPRRPLVRGIGTITPPDTPVLPPIKRIKEDVQYMDFPILSEEDTCRYIQKNKLMVIMKGLSGSGKSTLAKNIQKMYEGAIICSADDYFMVDGEYKFEFENLKDAHESCQSLARNSAKKNCPVIIIDNTNVRNWEYQVYLKICKENNYIPIVLEPQTPWRFQPEELSKKSTHGLEVEFLKKKLKSYQNALPIYYAWFLNEPDSQKITDYGFQWLETALREVETFFKDFSQFSGLDSVEDMLAYFTRDSVLLHVTSKFTARGKPPGAMKYIDDPTVKGALGRCYPIGVIGYVITPRTFGARVQLTEKELELWANDDHEPPPDNLFIGGGFRNKNEDNSPEDSLQNDDEQEVDNDIDICVDLCEPKISFTPQELDNRFAPTSGKGSRAHFTLGTAYGIKPVATGFDLISVVACEQSLKNDQINVNENDMAMDVDSPSQDTVAYDISGAVLKSYGEGRWVIYPETKASADSLFSAFY